MRLELTTYSMASCRSSQLSYARIREGRNMPGGLGLSRGKLSRAWLRLASLLSSDLSESARAGFNVARRAGACLGAPANSLIRDDDTRPA